MASNTGALQAVHYRSKNSLTGLLERRSTIMGAYLSELVAEIDRITDPDVADEIPL
jgi:hypothetical protein